MTKHIKPLKPGRPFNHVLPLTYDESLSYYEVLCRLQKKINELIEASGEAPDVASKEYVDSEVYKARNDLTSAFSTSQIHQTHQLRTEIGTVKDYSDTQNATLESRLNARIDHIIIEKITEVINPVVYVWQDINTVLDHVYNVLRYYAEDADHIDETEKTATQLDALNLTAYQYDLYSMNYFSGRTPSDI